jgi:hypothetical protein
MSETEEQLLLLKKCNIVNGLLGMKRDINLKLTAFAKNDEDMVEVLKIEIIFFFELYNLSR